MKKRKGYRQLDIGGEIWQWRHTAGGGAKVYSPAGAGHVISGEHAGEILSDYYGEDVRIAVPGKVAAYIRTHLRTIS